MKKKQIRLLVSSFVGGVLIGSLFTVVSAASTSGSWGSLRTNQWLFLQKPGAALSENGSSLPVNATTEVDNSGTGLVPTGYMGAQGRLYKSTGSLCSSENTYYNQSATSNLSVIVSGDCGTGIAYYSKGLTTAFNGNGYDSYNTFQSPKS